MDKIKLTGKREIVIDKTDKPFFGNCLMFNFDSFYYSIFNGRDCLDSRKAISYKEIEKIYNKQINYLQELISQGYKIEYRILEVKSNG